MSHTHMHTHIHVLCLLTCLLEAEFLCTWGMGGCLFGGRVCALTLAPLPWGHRHFGRSHQLRAIFHNYENTHPHLGQFSVPGRLSPQPLPAEGGANTQGPAHQFLGGERPLGESEPHILKPGS